MSLLSFFARRFVAGETADQAVAAAERANAQGIHAILDFLGEDVFSEMDARKAADEYLLLLRQLDRRTIRAAVSLKVSQMGLLVSQQVCHDHLRAIAREAAAMNRVVWFDMEGSALTQKTIEVFEAIRQEFKNVGLCLQASLVRTGGDFDTLLRRPLTVRLCKGAYKEHSTIAYTSKSAVDGHFRMLIQKGLDSISKGVYPAFATHDPRMIEEVQRLAREKGVSKEAFEFQMLYGIQSARLATLAKEGYRTCVYIPYGTHWLPYFTRRIRERKENLYFLMRNVFQK